MPVGVAEDVFDSRPLSRIGRDRVHPRVEFGISPWATRISTHARPHGERNNSSPIALDRDHHEIGEDIKMPLEIRERDRSVLGNEIRVGGSSRYGAAYPAPRRGSVDLFSDVQNGLEERFHRISIVRSELRNEISCSFVPDIV